MLDRFCPFCGIAFQCTGYCNIEDKLKNCNYCVCFNCAKDNNFLVFERYNLMRLNKASSKEKVIVCYGQDFVDSQIIDEI